MWNKILLSRKVCVICVQLAQALYISLKTLCLTHQNKIQTSQVFFRHLSHHENGRGWLSFLILHLFPLISYAQHEIFHLKVQLLQAQFLTRFQFFNYFIKLSNKFMLLNGCYVCTWLCSWLHWRWWGWLLKRMLPKFKCCWWWL